MSMYYILPMWLFFLLLCLSHSLFLHAIFCFLIIWIFFLYYLYNLLLICLFPVKFCIIKIIMIFHKITILMNILPVFCQVIKLTDLRLPFLKCTTNKFISKMEWVVFDLKKLQFFSLSCFNSSYVVCSRRASSQFSNLLLKLDVS